MFSKEECCRKAKELRDQYNQKSISNLAFGDLTLNAYKAKKGLNESRFLEFSIEIENEEINSLYREQIDHQNRLFSSYLAPLVIMNYVYGVIMFDDLLTKVMRLILKINWRKFSNSSERKLSNMEIFASSNLKELFDQLLEKELVELKYKSIDDQLSYLAKKFNFKVTSKVDKYSDSMIFNITDIDRLIKIFMIRNLMVHNDSVVNKVFLTKVKDSAYNLGDTINIEFSELKNTLLFLNINANHIINAFEKKYCG